MGRVIHLRGFFKRRPANSAVSQLGKLSCKLRKKMFSPRVALQPPTRTVFFSPTECPESIRRPYFHVLNNQSTPSRHFGHEEGALSPSPPFHVQSQRFSVNFRKTKNNPRKKVFRSINQMGREVLEGLRVSLSQQRPLSRKIYKRIIAHSVTRGQTAESTLWCCPNGLEYRWPTSATTYFACQLMAPHIG